ncbi:MAG TPA: DUF309 domain-containing protein [Myxococcota bacterium]|jgi:predicted metal-dependent hydrolase
MSNVSVTELPLSTWVPGAHAAGPRPDDAWLRAIASASAAHALVDVLLELGVRLFDRGQGFEAHEAWELAWREAKIDGRVDDERLLRALIKLAAAMVKVRQQNVVGVRDHARGAARVLEPVAPASVLHVDVAAVRALCARVHDDADLLVARAHDFAVGAPMFGRVPLLAAR